MVADRHEEVMGVAELPRAKAHAGSTDRESRRWLTDLRAGGETQRAATARLHELLLRAARFEVGRRQGQLALRTPGELDEIARDAAGDALISVVAHLDDFLGLSKFRTWAYKFAIFEAAVSVRRRAWRAREASTDAITLEAFASQAIGPAREAEQHELLGAIYLSIGRLTARQRRVLVALAIDGTPIDVLAEDLESTRGALYKVLHDARQALRRQLAAAGYELEAILGRGVGDA